MPSTESGVADRAWAALQAKGISRQHLLPLSAEHRAHTLATHGIAVAPAHRLLDGKCTCGVADCGTPAAHLIERHQLSDPWQCRHQDVRFIENAWRAYDPEAAVGFCLRLVGEAYERRFSFDGIVIRECIEYARIR